MTQDDPQFAALSETDLFVRAHLPARRWRVDVEETALCPVEVHNAGDSAAEFVAAVLDADGQPLDPAWVHLTPPRVRLGPGERSSLLLALTPPRSPRSRAGEHLLHVRVTSPQHPERATTISATLTVNPFVEIRVEPPAPGVVRVSWRQPVADLVLAVENRGNQEVSLGLDALMDDATQAVVDSFGLVLAEQDDVGLGPGQRRHLPVRVVCRPAALFAASDRRFGLGLMVGTEDGAGQPVLVELRVQPMRLGAGWLTAAALAVLAVVVAGLVGGLTWLSVGSAPGLPTPNPAAATRQVEAVTGDLRTLIVVVPPGPTLAPVGQASPAPVDLAAPPPLPAEAETQTLSPEMSAPEPASPPPAAPITYEAMFQEIAREFGLSWQMLAAQAYVESRLRPDALGRDGDMGLMQIIPATWGQWAPRAGVDPAAPYDAYGNVRVGAAYLAYLRAELADDGHPEDAWALAAYNWGLKNVRDLLAGGGGWESLPRKQRQYVTDILNLAGSIEEEN